MSRLAAMLLTGLLVLALGASTAAATKTPVTMNVLDGSTLTLADGRVIDLEGSARGAISGGYRLGRDNSAKLAAGVILGAGGLNLHLDPKMANRVDIARSGTMQAHLGLTTGTGSTLLIRPRGPIRQGAGLSNVALDTPQQWYDGDVFGAPTSLQAHLVVSMKIG